MKSIFLALVLVLSLVLALTSCGNQTPSTSSSTSSTKSVEEEGTGPGPLAGSPANESHIASQNPEFHWQVMPDATKYELQLSSQKDFSATIFSTSVSAANAKVPDTMKLANGSTYYWRVRVVEPEVSKWSDASSLIVD
jgi:hypothetical protein